MARRRDAASATCRSTSSETTVRDCADAARRRVPRARRARRRRRLRAPPRPPARARPARGSSRSSAARSATSCPAPRRRFLRELRRAPRRRTATCCSAPTSSRTRRVIEAAYDDSAGVTAEFNRNVLHVLNRELDADFDLDAVRARRVLRPPSASGSRCACARRRASTVRIAALDLDVDFAAREELRTEISAKFTPERAASATSRAAGLELVQSRCTDPRGAVRRVAGAPPAVGSAPWPHPAPRPRGPGGAAPGRRRGRASRRRWPRRRPPRRSRG